MFSFGRKKEKKETVLILDIGSGSTAVSLVELSFEEEPTILYVKRVPIKFQRSLTSARFRKEMIKSLNLGLRDVNKKGLSVLENKSKKSISRVLCSLSSPWFVSQTKVVRIKKDKPFVVTKKFMSGFIKEEEETFANSDLAKYSSRKKQDSEIIERKIIEIKLNGYKTNNPFNKNASEVQISLFMSMAPTDILNEIEETITKHFYINQIDFHSFTLISFLAIRDIYDRVSNFLFLDITGEVTDVSIVKKGNLLKSASYPVGKNSLIREATTKLKTIPEEARSAINLFLSGAVKGKKAKVLEKILIKSKEEWTKGLQNALVGLSGGMSLPTTVFFTSDEDISLWYSDAIRSEEFAQSFLTDNSFIVSFINCSSLGSYVRFRSSSEKDPFIALESIFFNRIFELEN